MPSKSSVRIPVKVAPAIRSHPTRVPTSKPALETSRTFAAKPPRIPSTARLLVRYGFYGVVSVCVGLFIRDNFFDFDKVSGASMLPTINPTVHETGQRDVIFVRPYLHSRTANTWGIRRGDVVTFWKPHKPEERGLKRVIALGGDVVYPKSGYALEPTSQVGRLEGMPDGLEDPDPDAVRSLLGKAEVGKVLVPYGHVWVEGDNWRSSLDSRDIGPISQSLVMGKVIGVWRGWGKWRGTEDNRSKSEREGSSKVVEGEVEVPSVFLE